MAETGLWKIDRIPLESSLFKGRRTLLKET